MVTFQPCGRSAHQQKMKCWKTTCHFGIFWVYTILYQQQLGYQQQWRWTLWSGLYTGAFLNGHVEFFLVPFQLDLPRPGPQDSTRFKNVVWKKQQEKKNICDGFHSHGGTPFMDDLWGNMPSRNGWWLGVPPFMETTMYLFLVKTYLEIFISIDCFKGNLDPKTMVFTRTGGCLKSSKWCHHCVIVLFLHFLRSFPEQCWLIHQTYTMVYYISTCAL